MAVQPVPAVAGLIEREITLSRFARVPLALAQNAALSAWDWRLYVALTTFTNPDGLAWPSRKTLAALLGLPDDSAEWPSQFYRRLARIPQRVNDGLTVYRVPLDPDNRCAWLTNTVCQYDLSATAWRILVALIYKVFSDAKSADPDLDGGDGLEINPDRYQSILHHAGCDGKRSQRYKYLRRAFNEFAALGWLANGETPGFYQIILPAPVSVVTVKTMPKVMLPEIGKCYLKSEKRYLKSETVLPEIGKTLPEIGKTLPEIGKVTNLGPSLESSFSLNLFIKDSESSTTASVVHVQNSLSSSDRNQAAQPTSGGQLDSEQKTLSSGKLPAPPNSGGQLGSDSPPPRSQADQPGGPVNGESIKDKLLALIADPDRLKGDGGGGKFKAKPRPLTDSRYAPS